MRTHLDRVSVALSLAVALGLAAATAGPAQALPNGPPVATRVPAANLRPVYVRPVYGVVPARRVIVIYKAAPAGGNSGAGNADTSSSGGNSGGSGAGGGGGGGGSGPGNVRDVFKQALGEFAKTAIDGLLKLPSK
jgi:uncharacterized membrane protein YgcG